MKWNVHCALALAGLMATALPAAAANAAAAVTIAQGSDYVMVSDGEGAMTSASANQTIGEGQMFAVTADDSVMVSQGGAEYALGSGTYSVDADGALLDGAGNPVADAGAGAPGGAGVGGQGPFGQGWWFGNAGIGQTTQSVLIGTMFISAVDYAQHVLEEARRRLTVFQIGPYATSS